MEESSSNNNTLSIVENVINIIFEGIFENDLVEMSRNIGNKVLLGAKVVNVELNEKDHQVDY